LRVLITIGIIQQVWFAVHFTPSFTQSRSGLRLSCVVRKNSAYYDLKRKAKKFNVYVVRYKQGNSVYQDSKPCKSCETSLKKIGFKKIIYSSIDGNVEKKNISELSTEHISKAQRVVKENLNHRHRRCKKSLY